MLFTLIHCLRPRRYLEVGVLHGGSALIVAKAMDAVQSDGKLILVDFNPQIEESNWRQMEHRSALVKGRSPQILSEACRAAGGPFDFVFVDGDHEATGVMRDAQGVLPVPRRWRLHAFSRLLQFDGKWGYRSVRQYSLFLHG